jgi:hypothetical protein
MEFGRLLETYFHQRVNWEENPLSGKFSLFLAAGNSRAAPPNLAITSIFPGPFSQTIDHDQRT